MGEKYIAAAVPVFLLLIGIELLIQRRRGDSGYRLNDALNDLSCGIGQQLLGLVFKGFTFAGYLFVYQHCALFVLPGDSPAVWLFALVGVDLCYYAMHRAGHRVNAVWAGHIVHHQSEDYNLAVALRQSWFLQLYSWVFYLPLALLGLPPLHYAISNLVNTLYQFWIHTEAIGRLGPLEWVFNTPSHHRVHHGINPRYIDKNYGGILIVWDRLFGTFAPEEEQVVYGTVKPLSSWNPVWANLHYWLDIARLSLACRRWRDRLTAFLRPPEWRPPELGGPVHIPPVTRAERTQYDVPTGRGLSAYVFLQFVAALAVAVLLLAAHRELGLVPSWLLGSLVMATLLSVGALVERRPWALAFEAIRLVALGAIGAWLAWPALPLAALAPAAALLCAFWLRQAWTPASAPEAATKAGDPSCLPPFLHS